MPPILRVTRRVPLLLLLAMVATGAHAQAVYRSIMPDGKVVYGNKPEPGAKEVKPMSLPPPNISAPTQPPSAGPADAQAPAGSSASTVAAAQQNLDAAKKALEAGREPLEGERIGIARQGSGTTRLTDAYFQRVKVLEDAVTTAQGQLEAARNAAR